ncbi:unnamed protein product, partial [Musa acuminata subsp. burmannicoides]
MLMVICSIAIGLSLGHTAKGIMATLCLFRFWLGLVSVAITCSPPPSCRSTPTRRPVTPSSQSFSLRKASASSQVESSPSSSPPPSRSA